MKAVRDGLLPAFAASFTIASLVVPAAPAKAAGWLTSSCTFAEANAALIFAVLAGFAAAFAILALIYRERARGFAHHSLRDATRLDTLGTVEDNYRALASLEHQVCVIWSDNHARLALHTLHATTGVPAKLPLLLRFASWLHPDDAGRVATSLHRLQTRGEGFVSNASTLEGPSRRGRGRGLRRRDRAADQAILAGQQGACAPDRREQALEAGRI